MIKIEHKCGNEDNFLHTALGIPEKRARQIGIIVDRIMQKESIADKSFCEIAVYRKILKAINCDTPEELAYVSYIYGVGLGQLDMQAYRDEQLEGLSSIVEQVQGEMHLPMGYGDMEVFKNAG